jgi:hypothetical protein
MGKIRGKAISDLFEITSTMTQTLLVAYLNGAAAFTAGIFLSKGFRCGLV